MTGEELKEIALKAGNYTIGAGMYFARFDWERIAADVMTKVNAELGDESNEAEKLVRRRLAVGELHGMFNDSNVSVDEVTLDAIIKEAQG